MALLNKYRYHNHHRDYPPAKRSHPGLDPGSFGPLKTTPRIFLWILKQVQDDGFYTYIHLTMPEKLYYNLIKK